MHHKKYQKRQQNRYSSKSKKERGLSDPPTTVADTSKQSFFHSKSAHFAWSISSQFVFQIFLEYLQYLIKTMGNSQESSPQATTSHHSSLHGNSTFPQGQSSEYREAQTMHALSKFSGTLQAKNKLQMIYQTDELSSIAEVPPILSSSDSDGTEDTDQLRMGVEFGLGGRGKEREAMVVEKREALTPSELKFYLSGYRKGGK